MKNKVDKVWSRGLNNQNKKNMIFKVNVPCFQHTLKVWNINLKKWKMLMN